MSSWWKLIAEQLAIEGGQGSHAKRVARHLNALGQRGQSAARLIALERNTTYGCGDWKRRIAFDTEKIFGASGRRLCNGVAALSSQATPRDAMLLGTYVNFDGLRDGQLAGGTFVNT